MAERAAAATIRRLRRYVAALILAAAGALALAGLARVLPALLRGPSQLDFGAYYVAARALGAGAPLYGADAPSAEALGVPGVRHSVYIYPPLLAAALRPIASLPYRSAELMWLAANVALLPASCLLIGRALRLPARAAAPLTLLALLLPAVYDTWLLGQVSVLLTALVAGSLALTARAAPRRDTDLLGGALLGIAAAIKVYPLLLAGVFLARRRWSALAGAALGATLATWLGALAGGAANTRDWLLAVAPATAAMVPFPSNQSLRAVLERLLTPQSFRVAVLDADSFVQVTLTPLVSSPALAGVLTALGSGAIALATAHALLRDGHARDLPSDMALATCAMLLVAPVVWDNYYVHVLLPLAALARRARADESALLALSAAALLLALQRYWRFALLYAQSPYLMLFGFLAVLTLWAALLRERHEPSRPGTSS